MSHGQFRKLPLHFAPFISNIIRDIRFRCNLVFVDMQTSFARYFHFVKSICFFGQFVNCPYKTRYDINLVAARQHIECVSTYRVIYDISKISQEIYIDALLCNAIVHVKFIPNLRSKPHTTFKG